MTKIAVLVGSLRAESINKKLAKAIESLAPDDVEFTYLDISEVPIFNQDNETDMPKSVQVMKDQIAEADGILFVTPEYNRGLPGVLKNSIDWLSRPYEDRTFNHKPVAVAGATGSAWGTVAAQVQLKSVLLYLNTHVLGQPELFIGGHNAIYDEDGNVTDEAGARLSGFLEAFLAHVSLFKA